MTILMSGGQADSFEILKKATELWNQLRGVDLKHIHTVGELMDLLDFRGARLDVKGLTALRDAVTMYVVREQEGG